MKILIVNTHDLRGGAARAAYRLHKALLTAGVDSQMLVQCKTSDDYTVIHMNSIFKKIRAFVAPTLDTQPIKKYLNRTKTQFSPACIPFSGISDIINFMKPDIVHLHWITDGMMRIEDIAKIRVPIVWSLHDMWAFTGGCHYDEECGAYQTGCGNCKVLGSSKFSDLSQEVFKRKQKSFAKISKNLTIIGLSQWLQNCAKNSMLFKEVSTTTLPNPIDTLSFSPINKKIARQLVNLPQNKKLVLFGATNAIGDPRKGFFELYQSLEKTPEDIELVILGSSQPKIPQGFKHKTHYVGYLHDDFSLRLLYSAVDVMIVPSLQENLSNAIMESLACGTPVVAFSIGGNSDLIDHKINGYLANSFDSTDLANGIEWILNTENHDMLSKNARTKILANFDSKIIANRYISLYKKINNDT